MGSSTLISMRGSQPPTVGGGSVPSICTHFSQIGRAVAGGTTVPPFRKLKRASPSPS
jgi:hypothetical protein